MDRGAWWATVHGVAKSRTQLSDFTSLHFTLVTRKVKNLPAMQETLGLFLGLGRSPGKRNGTHSSILAWKIPWTEEPGRLQFMESQRAGHD